jgi:hypothetical protein
MKTAAKTGGFKLSLNTKILSPYVMYITLQKVEVKDILKRYNVLWGCLCVLLNL